MDVPDYIFDKPSDAQKDPQLKPPDQGGLHIASVAAVDTTSPVTLVVQSQDYGGSAILTAKAVISGPNIVGGSVTVPFNVVALDPITNQVTKEDVRPPSCVGAADFAKHPFASLPVDQDCNGIADDWESKHGGPFPDPTVDDDQDGFSAFDEYRGFHQLDNQGNVTWNFTEPTKQDLFYWDPDGLTTTPMGQNDPNCAAPSGLAPPCDRLQNIFGAQTVAFISLHKVNAKQARGNEGDPSARLHALNSNSPFLASNGPEGFALVYVQAKQGGEAGDAGSFVNDGSGPILIDLKRVETTAQSDRQSNLWPAYALTLLDQVFAHETGHRLGRRHRTREALPVAYSKDGIDGLALGQFMQDPNLKHLNNLFVAHSIYALTTKAGFTKNQVENDEDIVSTVPAGQSLGPGDPVGLPKPPVWPYSHYLSARQPQPITSITLKSQDGTIMCWTPKLDQTQDSQWVFAPDDLSGLCLLPRGCE